MIKVNLTPDEELANPLWWVPEVACALIICLAAFGGVYYYLGQLQQQIVDAQIEIDALKASTAQLQPDVQKHDEIVGEKNKLISKVAGLRAITMSKVKRYRPLILLEHLQNLKPEGVWFTSLEMLRDGTAVAQAPAPTQPPPSGAPQPGQAATPAAPAKPLEQDEVAINGSAFDNLLVAEFMSTLKATQAQEVDPKDLRTQVYFETVELDRTEATTVTNGLTDANLRAQTSAMPVRAVTFSMKLKYREREVAAGNMTLSLRGSRDRSVKRK